MSNYVTNFKNDEDIIKEYNAPADALKGAKVLVAWYGYGDYCGSSFVVFKKAGKLYEVNGSHCSCYGLEGQWEPEETSWEAIAMRSFAQVTDYGSCDGESEAVAILQDLIKKYSKKKGS